MPTVIVAGASGVNGRAVAKHFQNLKGWTVKTLSRSGKADAASDGHISVDLLDKDAVNSALSKNPSITHIFYAALKPHENPKTEADENGTMFENLLSAAIEHCKDFERIVFLQGGKVYGAHLGVYKTPAYEDDSRHFPPNLYFNQEDIAKKYTNKTSSKIAWTALRPDIVIGHSLGSAMNMGNLIGIYGSLCKEMGVAMQFPGTAKAYDCLINMTDASIVAQAAEWVMTETKNGAFNITNGDVFRWKHVWPALANFFELEVGEPQPISLVTRLEAAEDLWSSMSKKYNLSTSDLSKIAQGDFGDFIFHVETDAIFDTTKIRQAGFAAMTQRTQESLLSHLQNMRDKKLIP